MFQQTFNKPNVRLVTNRIEEITKAGIRTDNGEHHELDTIIYATGRVSRTSILSLGYFFGSF